MKPVSVSYFFLVVGDRFLGDEMKSGLRNFLFPEKPKNEEYTSVFLFDSSWYFISLNKNPAGVYSMILKISRNISYLRWCFFYKASVGVVEDLSQHTTFRPVENGWSPAAASSLGPGGQAASARVTGVDAGHGFERDMALGSVRMMALKHWGDVYIFEASQILARSTKKWVWKKTHLS